MNNVTIKLLNREDADRLFEFETKNRLYFEKIGLSRDSTYYDRTLFQEILEELLSEMQKDVHYMYLVLDEYDEVVGRVNLTDIIRGPLKKAELGYRIGKQNQNKGYGTTAVKLIITEAQTVHNLHRLEAGTSIQNIGSQIVLIKNGFQFAGKYSQYILQGDDWIDSLLFEKILD